MNNIDTFYLEKGYNTIAGIDEAGRGPLAGPVVAAAVILPRNYFNPKINDSKKLNSKQRNELFEIIKHDSICWTFSVISHYTIDKINILNATLIAMKKSAEKLTPKPDVILIDGNKKFESKLNTITLVKGDSLSQSIAAASIVAKVIRDRIMERLDLIYPQYMLKQNKGYPTKAHIKAIREFGAASIHRETFLKRILYGE